VHKLGPRWVAALLVLGTLASVGAYGTWYELFRQEPQQFSSIEESFKYGSIGTEANPEAGMPYWIWRVLPSMFPEYLPKPGEYDAFGFVYEPGHETPVGFSVMTIGFPRVGITCAVCHTATYRTDPNQAPVIVPGGPAVRQDIQGYLRFLFACASDPRFTPDNILAEMRTKFHVSLNPIETALYRYVLIPRTRDGLLQQKSAAAWMDIRPAWGEGRIDPFNPIKFGHILHISPATDVTIGNSDMEPIWNMAQHNGYSLHWDGLNTSLTEVVLTGALGDGATPQTLPVAHLAAIEAWIRRLPPPRYPYPIDADLARQGERIFQQNCASCHAFGGARTGTVIPLAEIGTDGHRLSMWTQEAATRYNQYAAQYPWRFTHFVKTDGYVAVPLDGIWLRAPYLHNGSVPTIEALLEPAADRPTVFYRGYDVYMPNQMGFVDAGPDAERNGFRYDTTAPGNGNGGHEGAAYGTTLSAQEKRALIEYLKTL
jgi:hypothetical protein